MFKAIRVSIPTIVAAGCSVLAQSVTTPPAIIGFSPAPLWPSNGDTSMYPGQYVFFHPAAKEYIVSYPRADSSGEKVVMHVATHRSVDPTVTTTVSVQSDGRYAYSYTVQNSATAITSIDSMAMVMEQRSSDIVPGHAHWAAQSTASRPSGVAWSAFGTVVWKAPAGMQIQPGMASSGFTIVSDLAPGYTMMSFAGHSDLPDLTPEQMLALPEKVREQLATCKSVGWDTQTRQVIGPRFNAAVPVESVAANFQLGFASANGRALPVVQSPSGAASSLQAQSLVRPVRAQLKLLLAAVAEQTSSLSVPALEALMESATGEEKVALSALQLTLKHLSGSPGTQ